jgi:hypothetical protein
MFLASLMLLCTATLGAVARRGRERLPWTGAAIFGWAYLVVAFGPWANDKEAMHATFVTTSLFEHVIVSVQPRYMYPLVQINAGSSDFEPYLDGTTGKVTVMTPNITPCRNVANSIVTVLFALIGALLGLYFADRSESTDVKRNAG